MQCENPIMPGFYPDPSICRVGESYYMIHSSFNYFPGIPVFCSKNLGQWKQIGNALDRPSQISLLGCNESQGIYAPTIRCHDGVFYIITTMVNERGSGSFIITAEDPAGPWSDPHELESAKGIDPSLFFDDDGSCWYVGQRARDNQTYFGDCVIWLQRLDLDRYCLIGKEYILADGFQKNAVWPEGPHLYKKNGYYYLLHAEGGTEENHCIVVARSRRIEGPYEYARYNPILTHRHLGKNALVSCVGHGDMVEDKEGNWYMVVLGCRQEKGYTLKGRETFLAKVSWEEDWPVVNPGKGALETRIKLPGKEEREVVGENFWDFKKKELPMCFMTLRGPAEGCISFGGERGCLRMKTSPDTLKDLGNPVYAGVRLKYRACTAETELTACDFGETEGAGLALYQNNRAHIRLEVNIAKENNLVKVINCQNGEERILKETDTGERGRIGLRMKITGLYCDFCWKSPKGGWHMLLQGAELYHLSTEKAGGFTGCTVGMFASSNRKPGHGYGVFSFFAVRVIHEL